MTDPASNRPGRTRSVRAHRRHQGDAPVANGPLGVETLESRRLLAASPFVVDGTDRDDTIVVRQTSTAVRVTRNGSTLSRSAADVSAVVINGRGGEDSVSADSTVKVPLTVYGGSGDDTLRGGPRADVLHGQSGDDSVYGMAGNDRLYGGGDNDRIEGGDGDDVLVSLGDGADRVTGNGGHDNFWYDSGVDTVTDLTSSDARHLVASFMSYRIRSDGSYKTVAVPKLLAGQSLSDPVASGKVSGWRDFSGNPLFPSSGISEHDVDQNGASDCYFLAPLSSLAKIKPGVLTDRIVDLGDGTYAVHFERDGRSVFVRVDGDLPVNGSGSPYYAGLGTQKSLWVAVFEKAWAFFRRSEGTYDSTNFGQIGEPYRALGLGTTSWADHPDDFRSQGGLLEGIDKLLKAGHSVTYSTKNDQPSGSKLREDHVVMVDRVVRDGSGKAVSLVVRDQTRTDWLKSADGRDDGYITLTAREAAAGMEGVAWRDV
jgi:hypothetical protein